MINRLKRLISEEDGAVTVDWVVLTAGLLIFGFLIVSQIQTGLTNTSTGIGAVLSSAETPTVQLE